MRLNWDQLPPGRDRRLYRQDATEGSPLWVSSKCGIGSVNNKKWSVEHPLKKFLKKSLFSKCLSQKMRHMRWSLKRKNLPIDSSSAPIMAKKAQVMGEFAMVLGSTRFETLCKRAEQVMTVSELLIGSKKEGDLRMLPVIQLTEEKTKFDKGKGKKSVSVITVYEVISLLSAGKTVSAIFLPAQKDCSNFTVNCNSFTPAPLRPWLPRQRLIE
ncbi:UNVERIFIED_CONTAM: hypothetical protein FKN15_062506 [Acipenser sinensis]